MIRTQRGMTLIEVSIAVLVICTGVLATIGTYVHFSSATNTARERAALISVGQREIELLRPIGYSQLALKSSPTAQATSEAPLTGTAASEAVLTGGIVLPGGDAFSYQGVHGRIYRYVTGRSVSCGALTTKVQTQLVSVLSSVQSSVQASFPDLCAGTNQTKRITVIVVPTRVDGTHPRKGFRLSTIKRDPSALSVTPNGVSLSLKQATAGNVTVGSGVETLTTQQLSLLDTRCSDTVRAAPTDHATRDTAQASFTCAASGPAPTLMSLQPIVGSASDPLRDFSTDITRAAQGGLALLRDTTAGSCTDSTNLVYTNAEATTRSRSIHAWASLPAGVAFKTPTNGGRASVSLWSSTADGSRGPGRLCLTLRVGTTGQVLGSSDFSLPAWPDKPTELVTAFDLTGTTIATGTRLILTARVPKDSGEDIRILYDHPSYQSTLSLTTVKGSELQ